MTSCSHYEGIWYVADSGELLTIGDHLAFIQYLDDLTVSLICRDHHALIELAAWLTEQCVWLGEQLPDVSARGGANGLEFGGVSWRRWRIHTGRSQLSDGDCEKGEAGERPGGPEDALWTATASDEWADCVRSLGLRPRMSAGTTAVALLPDNWIRASRKLASTDAWQEVRGAYYGGRVQLFRKFKGEAVEHDLVSAYGSVLSGAFGYLPDWKIYPDREPWCDQPAWLDVTVRVNAEVAPLPYRLPERTWSIEWPTSGTWRAWYPYHELQTPGVEIVTIHGAHSGRWDYALFDRTSALLAQATDRYRKAVVKQLLVSLAGKLAQKPISWRVWRPSDDLTDCPDGLYSFTAEAGSLDVYPTRPAHHPPSYLPQVATYVTSAVRIELRNELERAGSRAIYCDTDAVHAAAGDYRPKNYGSAAGQWSEKAAGAARYYARRHYFVGRKRVGC
tara:strand:+ start:578 stop:1921 length:1344 start_codon:yes stop_codon:yes gene_type:complete